MTRKKIIKKNAKAKHKPSTKRTLEDVLSSLQDLAKNELSDVDLISRAGDENELSDQIKFDQDKKKTSKSVESNETSPIQMDVTSPQTELESGETGDIFDSLELLPADQISESAENDQNIEAAPENNQESSEEKEEEIRWEDIPVLEDVADEPEAFEAPDPRVARKIAIQVAARLNIEMHKQGLDGLDIATINRLRALLVKELAKAASKSENGDY